MYTNAAYIDNSLTDAEDFSRPLVVKCCGNYRFISRSPQPTYRPKGRSDYQLLYIASGQAHFFFDGEEKVLPAGHIVLYRPGEFQKYTYYAKDMPEVFWIHFTGYDVENILSRYNLNSNLFFTGASMEFNRIFIRIINEIRSSEHDFQDLLALLLQNIFLLADRYITQGHGYSNNIKKEVDLAIHYFNENFSSQISIEDYARSRHISPCWFIRSFKKYIGVTPMQYILSIRISNARFFLENTDDSISEISSMVGYDNSLYFSRIFKKQTGLSPQNYRKKHKP